MRNSSENGYSIRQVIELTGASEFLLRSWENRYSAFHPRRTKTGRRRYLEVDVLRARALVLLTSRGARVGQVATLSLAQLQALIERQEVREPGTSDPPLVQEIVSAASQYKWHEARSAILREKDRLQPIQWIHRLLTPLVTEMARQADSGRLSIAQERILSATIKESLFTGSAGKVVRLPRFKKPRIVFGTPEGDHHDLGLTIGAFIAREMGAETLFLGSHIPKRELSEVSLRFHATHLVLTSTASKKMGAREDYLQYLHFLDHHLDPKITLWLGGRNAVKDPVHLKRSFQIFDSFQDFEEEVRKCLE
ncbi:MerR family transcriptional regulator [bacterium]|jgi:DNA-binding transcriptional MerR regulator/methylmalonyl-CoA mutase cobalamin-binding subunit|nr:MerR family transcriptional regulator [bacterium]